MQRAGLKIEVERLFYGFRARTLRFPFTGLHVSKIMKGEVVEYLYQTSAAITKSTSDGLSYLCKNSIEKR